MKIYNSPDGHLFVQHGDGSWSFVCFEGSDDTDWIRRTFEPPEPMDELVEWRATATTYPDPTGVPGPPLRDRPVAPCPASAAGGAGHGSPARSTRTATWTWTGSLRRELDANILAWGEFRRTHGEPPDHADGPETAEHLGKWLARLIDQLHSEAS
jgi:hypothetical protein